MAAGLVFVAGQLPIAADGGKLSDAPFEAQVAQVLANVEAILRAAGSSIDRLVQVRVYLSDVALWGEFNRLYAAWAGDARPVRAVVPVGPETPVALSSPARTVEGLIRVAEVTDAQWGPLTAINMPALRTTVGDMAQALERVAGPVATSLLDWTPDPAILKLVKTWPGNVASARANAMGLHADSDFETVIRDYVRENPSAVKLPVG